MERKYADTAGTVLVSCMGWQFPVLLYKCIFRIKYTDAILIILSNGARKLLWFEISKMMIAVLKKEIIALFIIIFSARFRFLF